MKFLRKKKGRNIPKAPKKNGVKIGENIVNFFANTKAKILAWSFQQKIVAGVTAFALVLGATTTGILLHNRKPAEEEVAVAEQEEVEEVKVEGNKVDVPTFNEYHISTESMVKDLKIYFTDANNKRISGVPFSVIMTTSKKLKAVNGIGDCVKVIDADTALIKLLESSGLGGIEYTPELSAKLDAFVAEHGGKLDGTEEEIKKIAIEYGASAEDITEPASEDPATENTDDKNSEEKKDEKKSDSKKTGKISSGVVTASAKKAGKSETTTETVEKKTEDTKTEEKETESAATTATAESEFDSLIASGKPLLNAETEQPLTIKEYYLVKKQNDIVTYQALLSDVEGKTYNDEDGDGIIKIEKIDGGDYILLCNPQNGYDTATYQTKATVKAELEYKKVENIKQEVVKDAGDTKPADAAPVEAKLTDTVEYVKSSKKTSYTYTATGAPAYKAAVSGAPATKATGDGGSVTVNQNGGTLYALNSADANQMAVSFAAKAGSGNGTFSDVTVKSSNAGIKVAKNGDGTYLISTPSGTKSTSGKVTFTTKYTYKKTITSSKKSSGNRHVAATKKAYIASPAVAKKTSGGFIRTSEPNTNTEGQDQATPAQDPATTTTEKFTVSFDTDGGKESYAAQEVAKDGTATNPGTPTKDNFTFKGWYNGGSAYDFSTPVTGNLTLKAQWEATAAEKFTVSFDTDGGKESYAAQQVEKNGKATNPGTPTKDNATFEGWYSGDSAYNFDTPVTGNLTLKARWKAVATTTQDVTETITVEVNIKVVGAETKVTAADGQKLYSAQDTKKQATLADIAAGKTLYTAQESVVYTGWQSIGGKSFYYTKDHQVVTGEQVIQGVKYNFGGDGALLPSGMGVDVSKWQGNIDWGALAPNISFAIIRCGYRGSGGLSVDPQYARNMQQAKANGVRVGIYIYSKATNEAMAVEEASLAIQLAQEQGGVSLPIYMDMEDGSQKGLSRDELTNIANAFCATVASAGYRPGVYASYNWWNQRLNAGAVNGSKWVARYNTQCGMACDIWQYSSKGTLPGIGGNVDINQSYF